MKPVIADHDEQEISLKKYIIGFVLSVVLTLSAYTLVVRGSASVGMIAGVVVVLALAQFMVQMMFFLHIGEERRPRWKFGAVLLMLCFVLILVLGSLWIMHNLNYRMTPSQDQTEQYLKEQDGGI